ncbi:hypothetical protein ACQEDT_18295, partial [Agrobacterium pusense]|uniref:hypothetical protein n=1 Tax=Agrobacterium pusense TaxID=648995 RepID=UPI003D11A4F0
FSFFSYSIVKKQTTKSSQKIKSPKPIGLETKQATSSFLDLFRTKDFVASSARRPRSVSGLIREPHRTSQQPKMRILKKSIKLLIIKVSFRFIVLITND